ncbi:MAG TPA: DUF3488 domain-containing protein [Planctomycetes bacterium]|nr:DUF3488 domain-containing protein [Planctomycetaceae bacterium]HIN55037.1 DUF3488 domain-containing protein [Planctomycetota bacterium]
MKVERNLQICTAAVAVIGSMLLGIGERAPELPLMMLMAALTSVIFTDILGWLRLPKIIANIFMIFIAVIAFSDFFNSTSQLQLYAVANLLVYVQIVILFQQKTARLYGHLAVFSLLQVVVASLLNVGVIFGALLFVYLIFAFLALSLFNVYRQISVMEKANHQSILLSAQSATTNTQSSEWAFLMRDRPRGRTGIALRSVGDQTIATGFFRYIIGIGMIVMVFTMVFFYCIPRTGNSAWHHPGLSSAGRTGMTREITLGQVGQILDDDRLALRVSFTDEKINEPYEVAGDPYLSGTVLTRYVPKRGSSNWLPTGLAVGSTALTLESVRNIPLGHDLVRQDITVEVVHNPKSVFGDPLLPAVYPIYAARNTPEQVRYDPFSRQLFLNVGPGKTIVDQYRYSVVTTAFSKQNQQTVTPVYAFDRRSEDTLRRKIRAALELPAEVQSLTEFTRDLLTQRRVDTSSSILIARDLENYLTSQELFTYSLSQFGIERDLTIDPVLDFVMNHRTGHCEYFASALALMLRSQGIPARIVIGYHGGEYNKIGEHFKFRNSDAHAWVEMFIPPETLPALDVVIESTGLAGAWVLLDPTPSRDDQLERTLYDEVVDSFEYAQLLWDNYVLTMDPQQQEEALRKLGINNVGAKDLGVSTRLLKSIGIDFDQGLLRSLAKPQSLLIFLLVISLLLGAGRWIKLIRWGGLLRLTRPRNTRLRTQQASVMFYRRMEKFFTRRGQPRYASQTQREYASELTQWLCESEQESDIVKIPNQVVDLFYAVRFGDSDVTHEQLLVVENCLSSLSHRVRKNPKRMT